MMVLPLIMKTEKNFKQEKKLKFTQLCNFQRALEKISVSKNLRLEIFLAIS